MYGGCDVWELQCVGSVVCGVHGMWGSLCSGLQSVVVAVNEGCCVWLFWCIEDIVHIA